jgi:hypothetical protein
MPVILPSRTCGPPHAVANSAVRPEGGVRPPAVVPKEAAAEFAAFCTLSVVVYGGFRPHQSGLSQEGSVERFGCFRVTVN